MNNFPAAGVYFFTWYPVEKYENGNYVKTEIITTEKTKYNWTSVVQKTIDSLL
jgi:hypothetical protein